MQLSGGSELLALQLECRALQQHMTDIFSDTTVLATETSMAESFRFWNDGLPR